jgi:hypothetical protein
MALLRSVDAKTSGLLAAHTKEHTHQVAANSETPGDGQVLQSPSKQ